MTAAKNSAPWNPVELPVDKLKLAGRLSPGLCDITGASSPRKWEEREGYGFSGAMIVFRGIGLGRFTAKFRLYTAIDWTDWQQFKSLLYKPPVGVRAKAMDVYHPLLHEIGIVSCVVEDLIQPEQTGDGEWTIEVRFIEYRSPKYALATPDGAEATPADPDQVAIGLKWDQLESLANEGNQ